MTDQGQPMYPYEGYQPNAPTYDRVKKDRRRHFTRVGISLAVLLVVTFVMQYVVLYLASWLLPHVVTAWWFNWVLSFLPLYGFGLPAYLLSFMGMERAERCHTYSSRGMTIEKPKFGVPHFLLMAVVGFGLLYIGNFIGTALMAILSALTGYDYQNALASIVDNSPTWMVFLGTVILAPIGEEFLFRKLLIDRTRGYGDVASIFISAAFFGLFHGNFFQFFYAFLLGIVLAYMYTWSGKIGWSIALHMLINLMGGVVMPWLIGQLNLEGDPMTDPTLLFDCLLALGIELVIFGLMLAAVVIVICLFCMRKVYVGKGNQPLTLTSDDTLLSTVFNAGMILAVVLYVLTMLLSLIPT